MSTLPQPVLGRGPGLGRNRHWTPTTRQGREGSPELCCCPSTGCREPAEPYIVLVAPIPMGTASTEATRSTSIPARNPRGCLDLALLSRVRLPLFAERTSRPKAFGDPDLFLKRKACVGRVTLQDEGPDFSPEPDLLALIHVLNVLNVHAEAVTQATYAYSGDTGDSPSFLT